MTRQDIETEGGKEPAPCPFLFLFFICFSFPHPLSLFLPAITLRANDGRRQGLADAVLIDPGWGPVSFAAKGLHGCHVE